MSPWEAAGVLLILQLQHNILKSFQQLQDDLSRRVSFPYLQLRHTRTAQVQSISLDLAKSFIFTRLSGSGKKASATLGFFLYNYKQLPVELFKKYPVMPALHLKDEVPIRLTTAIHPRLLPELPTHHPAHNVHRIKTILWSALMTIRCNVRKRPSHRP